MFYKLSLILSTFLLTAFLITGCQDHQIPSSSPSQFSVKPFATGLVRPIGVETDGKGRVFVTEQGSGNNDGRLSEIAPDGTVYPIVTGIYSVTNMEGDLDAVDHLLYIDGMIYFLNPKGLYKINVAAIKTGAPPVPASTLTPEDIRKFVLAYDFKNDTGESHLYNLAAGPDGALYITDAAANAIIRRSKTGELSVMTEIPSVVNPGGTIPPTSQGVPTGIIFDGTNFRISTLIGFPFVGGTSVVYKMDLSGSLSVYQKGFTSLVDIENDGNGQSLVIQHGAFGAMGFGTDRGKLIRANGTASTVLIDKLNQPTDLKLSDSHTAYIVSLGDNSVLKVTF